MAVDGSDWSEKHGNVTVRVSHIGGRGGPVLPDVPPQAWRRGAKFVDIFGVERALLVLDRRAERALFAGRIGSACNWRDLMAAVHSMSENERGDGKKDH